MPYSRRDFLGVALAAGVLPILPAAVHAASPIRGLSHTSRKSLELRDCVVGLEGLERPNRRL